MRNIEEIISRQIHNWDRTRSILEKRSPGDQEPPETPQYVRPLPVIAVSRQLGAGSRRIIENISRRTGYETFGCALIEKVADDIHVQRRIVDRLDENLRSKIETFVEGAIRGRDVSREEYFRALLRVIRALIVQGGVTLLGRGATFVVEPHQGVRVRLIAPLELRLANLKEYSDLGADKAKAAIEESDANRRDFCLEYFKKDLDDPIHYDLVINTANVAVAAAASIILRAMEAQNP